MDNVKFRIVENITGQHETYRLQKQYHFLWIPFITFWLTLKKTNSRFIAHEWYEDYKISDTITKIGH